MNNIVINPHQKNYNNHLTDDYNINPYIYKNSEYLPKQRFGETETKTYGIARKIFEGLLLCLMNLTIIGALANLHIYFYGNESALLREYKRVFLNAPINKTLSVFPTNHSQQTSGNKADSAINTSQTNSSTHISIETSFDSRKNVDGSKVESEVEFNWEELSLCEELTDGCSRCPVFKGKLNGRNVIVKLVYGRELEIISLLRSQNQDYVVSVLAQGSLSELQKSDLSQLQNFIDADNIKHPHVIVMECLDFPELHNPGKRVTFSEGCFGEFKPNEGSDVIGPLPEDMNFNDNVFQDMIDILKIVRYLHSQNVAHFDIKQSNIGRDEKTKRLKIFDFGDSIRINNKKGQKLGEYDQTPEGNDNLAMGKLFINILANCYVMAPGRHYDTHRFAMNQYQLFTIVDYLPISEKFNICLKKLLDVNKEYDPTLLDFMIQDMEKNPSDYSISRV